MNTEYVYAMAEEFRRDGAALYAKAERVMHDLSLSPVCREALSAGFRTQGSLAYDQATELDNEARRIWRGEAA